MTRTVLVTGASSGIGHATAETFHERGWCVYATVRDPDDIADLQRLGCRIARLDVTDDGDATRVVERIAEERDSLDCLVNNAGYGQYGPIEDIPAEQARDQFDVNVYGPHRLVRAALPLLRRVRGAGGEAGSTVVTVSSMAAHLPFPGAGVYCASKAATEAMHDALRVEVEPDGIDVVLVEPGPIETGFTARRQAVMSALDQTDEYEDVYDRHRGATTRGAMFGDVSAADVADDIYRAAVSPSPPARVPVGTRVTWALRLARMVPRHWRDRVYDWLG